MQLLRADLGLCLAHPDVTRSLRPVVVAAIPGDLPARRGLLCDMCLTGALSNVWAGTWNKAHVYSLPT